MNNYRKQYFQTYLWKTISIILGFISLFIVVPYLSSDKTLYGIYSVCTSLTIFFSYADLGFLSSGAKFAAEYYVKGDYKNEVKVIGFTAFFMAIIFSLVDLILLFLAVNPQLLIPELVCDSEQFFVTQSLIILLFLGCPLIIGQRILQIIYIVRVEEYKFQRLLILGSILRIISVFFFFRNESYNIVGYYLFYQIINLFVIVAAFWEIKQYGFKFKDLIKSFKFNKQVFHKEKALSLSTFIFMLSMMFYNEFDQIAISNIFGIDTVSIYAIAFSIMTYMRTYSGLIYSPFISRFNHFTGLGDYEGLILFTKKIILFFAPILIIPLLNVALYADAIVISWVGYEYKSAAILISWMVMSYAVNFITTPLSSYMIAMEKNKKIVVGAILLPLIYWFGIIILLQYIGYQSFAVMKFFGPALLVFYYWNIIIRDIKKSKVKFISFKELFISVVPPIVLTIVLSCVIRPVLNYSQDVPSLVYNVIMIILGIIISLFSALIFNIELRQVVVNNLKLILLNRK